MQVTSPAFSTGSQIPVKYTIDGESAFIPLRVHDVPPTAVTLALVFDDPDVPVDLVPSGLFVHWLVWNIDPAVAAEILAESPPPGVLGSNTRGMTDWVAPAPPPGHRAHRYVFTVYALDCTLTVPPGSSRDTLLAAITGHEIERARLIGTFAR